MLTSLFEKKNCLRRVQFVMKAVLFTYFLNVMCFVTMKYRKTQE